MKTLQNLILPVIETNRLSLAMFDARDLDSAFQLFNDDAVQKYLSPRNRRTRKQMKFTLQSFSKRWKEQGFGIWRVGDKSSDEMFGYCGFQYFDETPEVEILFAFFKDFWGKGFATEAADACLKFGFEKLSFAKVFAATHPENLASRSILEKIGMTFEKRKVQYGLDSLTYSISRRNFKPAKDFYNLTYKNFEQDSSL